MTDGSRASLGKWVARHTVLVWLGVILNLLFAIPLIFYPFWITGLFDIPLQQSVWARFSGLLLAILSVFYIPATIDLARYRVFAWLAVFPSRTGGVVFFFTAVVIFGQPLGLIIGTLLDGSIGLATLICLIRITAIEKTIAAEREYHLGGSA